jgi:ribonuclease P protein component
MYIYSLPGAPRLSQTPSTGLYLGSFAPSSLNKSAVKRNYMRRRCREALRQTVEEFAHLPSMQILVSPRIASHSAPFDDILSDAQAFFSTLPSHVTKKKLSTT